VNLYGNVKRPEKPRRMVIVFAVIFAVAILPGALNINRQQTFLQQIGYVCDNRACRPAVVPGGEAGEPFREGVIDLTGDGISEIVRREDNRLFIFQDGVKIWSSNPSWQVVDAALGDPNDDGRNDIMVALWKPDQDGVLTSHPFIVGYRGGLIKTIWGGSAVAYGIHELLLADVDGDGVQELIVIESAHPGEGLEALLRTLSVWDWHGWGFTLRWRSEPGRFCNLGFAPDPSGGIIIIEQIVTYKGVRKLD
jgi:hypothetical protein